MSQSRRTFVAGLLALPLLAWLHHAWPGLRVRRGWVLRDGD